HRRPTADRTPPRLFRQQLRRQPPRTTHRFREGDPRGPPRDPLADERDDAGVRRSRCQSGGRGDGVCDGGADAEVEGDYGAEVRSRGGRKPPRLERPVSKRTFFADGCQVGSAWGGATDSKRTFRFAKCDNGPGKSWRILVRWKRKRRRVAVLQCGCGSNYPT